MRYLYIENINEIKGINFFGRSFLAFNYRDRPEFNAFLADSGSMAGFNHICNVFIRIWCLEYQVKYLIIENKHKLAKLFQIIGFYL